MKVTVGDIIEVSANKVGTPPRRGEVKEIIDAERPELRVVWDDGHESVFYPSGGMTHVVKPAAS